PSCGVPAHEMVGSDARHPGVRRRLEEGRAQRPRVHPPLGGPGGISMTPPMPRALLAAAALASLAFPTTSAAQPRVRVVVLNLEPASPELKATAGVLTGVLLDELTRVPHVSALGSSEIATLIGLERQRTLLGCEAEGSECLAEMGNALGAKYVVRGMVGAL